MSSEYHRALADAHDRLLQMVRAARDEHKRIPRSPLMFFARKRSMTRFDALGDACAAIADLRVKAMS